MCRVQVSPYQLVASGGGDDDQLVARLGEASDLWLGLVGVRCRDGVGGVLRRRCRAFAKVDDILACSMCQALSISRGSDAQHDAGLAKPVLRTLSNF